MKFAALTTGLVVSALMALSAPSYAAEAKQDFQLVNKTGYDISNVYVSPTKSDDWEEDVLGQDMLQDGERVTIRFKRATRTCKWDLKVVYDDDDSTAVWSNIDLCSVARVTIRYNRKSDTTSATFD